MKKLSAILSLLLFIGVQVQAQKEVLFKIKYLPNHNYSSVSKTDMNMEMDIAGDTAAINKIKRSGKKLPLFIQVQKASNIEVKTGPIVNNSFSVVMHNQVTVGKTKINGIEQPAKTTNSNIDIYGICNNEGKIKVDSIGGKTLNDALKQQLTQMISSMQSSIKFPDKPMKIGDTFSQDLPMDLPIAGLSVKLLVKGVYKLIGIESNKAYFDITFTVTMDMSDNKMSLDMTGGGDGKVIYDIESSYATKMQESINVTYSLNLPDMTNLKMSGKANAYMDHQTTITAN
jgi:hypothetical protein